MNIIVWLEFELTNYDVAVQHVTHYGDIVVLVKKKKKEKRNELYNKIYIYIFH